MTKKTERRSASQWVSLALGLLLGARFLLPAVGATAGALVLCVRGLQSTQLSRGAPGRSCGCSTCVMRVLDVPPLRLRVPDVDAALDAVFSQRVLRRVHGTDLVAPPFENDERTFTFGVDVSGVPRPLRCFFRGSRVHVTTRQEVRRDQRRRLVTVTNHIKMHFVGAELFRVQPAFELGDGGGGGITLGGRVRHTALLPWPLKGVAERFMCTHSERELRRYADVLRECGVA